MLSERPKVEQAVQAVCGRLGIRIRRTPADHAGGKWRLSYDSIAGSGGNLELDVNFMLRTPLWPPAAASSRHLGSFGVTQVPMLDVHELAAGKLAALFGRAASRDLFDVRELLGAEVLDAKKLRTGLRKRLTTAVLESSYSGMLRLSTGATRHITTSTIGEAPGL